MHEIVKSCPIVGSLVLIINATSVLSVEMKLETSTETRKTAKMQDMTQAHNDHLYLLKIYRPVENRDALFA